MNVILTMKFDDDADPVECQAEVDAVYLFLLERGNSVLNCEKDS